MIENIPTESLASKLRTRDEMMKKAHVTEAIEALFGTMFSVAYAEINRIENKYPWFDEEDNKGGLDFDFFYTIVVKSLEHLMKDKPLEQRCAIADLVLNDLAEMTGLQFQKDNQLMSCPEIQESFEGEK